MVRSTKAIYCHVRHSKIYRAAKSLILLWGGGGSIRGRVAKKSHLGEIAFVVEKTGRGEHIDSDLADIVSLGLIPLRHLEAPTSAHHVLLNHHVLRNRKLFPEFLFQSNNGAYRIFSIRTTWGLCFWIRSDSDSRLLFVEGANVVGDLIEEILEHTVYCKTFRECYCRHFTYLAKLTHYTRVESFLKPVSQ